MPPSTLLLPPLLLLGGAGSSSDRPQPPPPPLVELEPVQRLRESDSAATFQAQCLRGAVPCLLPASLAPATRSDFQRWSREGLLSRHADTPVVLGTNHSLAARGAPAVATSATRVGDYLTQRQCTDQGHPGAGYLFLSAGNEQSHGALLDDAAETAERWSRGGMAEFLRDLGPTEAVVAVSVDRGGGIPWHRHHAAWLLLLHGTKRWHLYPPSASPPKVVLRDDGHAEWIRSVLPSLPAPQRPLEAVQQRGELLYVPEGWCVQMPLPQFSCLGAPNQVYITLSHFVRLHDSNLRTCMRPGCWLATCRWHATISDDNEFSIAIGAQAQHPESRGSLHLAIDVVPLMEAGV